MEPNVSQPSVDGQDSTDLRPISAAEARRYMRDLSRLTRSLERYLDQPDPADDEPTIPDVAPLALLSNGRVLLHVSELEGVDLSSFDRWEGVILSEAEAADLQDRISHGMAEAAGMLGGWLLKRLPRTTP